eukprot:CAMPEP_0170582416 /NCGR_PEP_ID=MMETSP0224-20130122/7572_1 /TAXON_ID=285029 /ORGANISM="Togula jolla, Strain CCCM 725" /LENGTH=154 /DNA_ID=CAMNT_0010905639 /DNA_START=185 /DNA_END=647 /DNA_ORIENTATION=+
MAFERSIFPLISSLGSCKSAALMAAIRSMPQIQARSCGWRPLGLPGALSGQWAEDSPLQPVLREEPPAPRRPWTCPRPPRRALLSSQAPTCRPAASPRGSGAGAPAPHGDPGAPCAGAAPPGVALQGAHPLGKSPLSVSPSPHPRSQAPHVGTS